MPTYDYQCRSCGNTTEVIHSMLEDGPTTCERCGGVLRRVLFPAGIIFKGSGFYKTDSRSSGSAPTSTAAAGDKTASDAGGAAAPAAKGEGGKPSSPSSASGGEGSGKATKPSPAPAKD